jgi:hypothetical protein
MEWYYIVMLTGLYFTMGFGVFKLWKEVIDTELGFIVVLFWPLVLFVTAFCKTD